MVSTKPAGVLPFLILGLLADEPRSGYDLRKIFRDTPMASFSDSPGSIYPALRALERRKLVQARTDASRPLRPRRLYRATAAGRAALVEWLRQPVVGHDVARDADAFGARLAFMSARLSPAEIERLTELHAVALREHVEGVRAFARQHTAIMPFSARMALEGGVALLQARLCWVERVLHELKHRRPR